jgi:hypothetical protein
MGLRKMKIRDRRGWVVRRYKGQPIRNAMRVVGRTCILTTFRFRHL